MKHFISICCFLKASILVYGQTENIDRFEFKYTCEKNQSDTSLIYVDAVIMNNTMEKVYFLSESCNGLDYYLTTNSPMLETYRMIRCNATFPRKIEIDPNSGYAFNVILKKKTNVQNVILTLTLVELTSTTKVDGRYIDEIKIERVNQTIKINGPIIKMK